MSCARRHKSYTCFFFFNDTATTEIYTLSLHDALPIYSMVMMADSTAQYTPIPSQLYVYVDNVDDAYRRAMKAGGTSERSEEHTSELQSLAYLVCRLLLEKKKKATTIIAYGINATTHSD